MPRFKALPTPAYAHERRDGSVYMGFGNQECVPHSQFDVSCDYDVAKLIVDACSAHEANTALIAKLVEALERMTTTYRGFEDGNGDPCPDVAFGLEVLSLAKSETR